MKKIKRKAVRAIVFVENKIMSMYRERDNSIYYTFPGGGQEKSETKEECAIREVIEEFGINVKPIKQVYVYENNRSIEYFYICEWISGEFGSGKGEEFQAGQTKGLYKPTLINIIDIPNLPLMPPEVAAAFYKDYMRNGETLRKNTKLICATDD